jgi:hypothetical protein
MANEIQTARNVVKSKLDIATGDTTFDTILTEAVQEAIPRVYPYVQNQLAEDTSVTLATGDDKFTIPTAGSVVENIYWRATTADAWEEVESWRQWNDIVYLEEVVTQPMTVKVLAKSNFAVTDAGLLALQTKYPAVMLPIYYFAMAQFAIRLIGNKRKFNIYQQMNGNRTLSEMQELHDFYDNNAKQILEDEISAEGR